MGEMADFNIEQGLDQGWHWFGKQRRQPRDTRVRCKHCGADCTWHHTGARWALLDANARLHVCQTDAEDFPVVP